MASDSAFLSSSDNRIRVVWSFLGSIIVVLACLTSCTDSAPGDRSDRTRLQRNSDAEPFTVEVLNEQGDEVLGERALTETVGEIVVKASSEDIGTSDFVEVRLSLDGHVVRTVENGTMPFERVFSEIDFSKWDGRPTQAIVSVEMDLPNGEMVSSTDNVVVSTAAGALERLRSNAEGAVSFTQGRGTPSAIMDIIHPTDSGTPVDQSLEFIGEYEDLFRIDNPSSTLVPTDVRTDKYGATHVMFEQHVKGFPLIDTRLSIHMENGYIWRMHGRYYPQRTLDTAPDEIDSYANGEDISVQKAKEKARKKITKITGGVDWRGIGQSRLMLVRLDSEESLRLAWRVSLAGIHIPKGRTISGTAYVDSSTGEVLRIDGVNNPKATQDHIPTPNHREDYKASVFDANGKSMSKLRSCFTIERLGSSICTVTNPYNCKIADADGEKFVDFSDDYDGFLYEWYGLDSPSGTGHRYNKGTHVMSSAYSGTVNADTRTGRAHYGAGCNRTVYPDGGVAKSTVYHELTHQFSEHWNNIAYKKKWWKEDGGALKGWESETSIEEHIAMTLMGVAQDWRGNGFQEMSGGINAKHDNDLSTGPPLDLSEVHQGDFGIYERGRLFNHMYDHLVRGGEHKGALSSVFSFRDSPFTAWDVGMMIVHASKYGGKIHRVDYKEYLGLIMGSAKTIMRNQGFQNSGDHLCWLANGMASIGYKTWRVNSNCDKWLDMAPAPHDDDGDGVMDHQDKCPKMFNATRDLPDRDGDGVGDMCDQNIDGDAKYNDVDPCPKHRPIGQDETDAVNLDPDGTNMHRDRDGDGNRDRCSDPDSDGVSGVNDNCPYTKNPRQKNSDDWGGIVPLSIASDGKGDKCDDDADGDGYTDDNGDDNCRDVYNPFQKDVDNDGIGDACSDSDLDGVPYSRDNCPSDYNPPRTDTDGDGKPDKQLDTDMDGIGDECDGDRDGDGEPNYDDSCPGWNKDEDDLVDVDDDGLADHVYREGELQRIKKERRADCDNCPEVKNPTQENTDRWDERYAKGDACDMDDDSDNVPDSEDNCPKTANAEQVDRDDDGEGWACEPKADYGTEIPPRVKGIVSAYDRLRGKISRGKDFSRRATNINRIQLRECLASVCGSSGEGRVPDNIGRVTTVEAPNRFKVLLTDGEGQIQQRVSSQFNEETGQYVAAVSWEVEKGAQWPSESALGDMVITDSHFIRVLPNALEDMEPQAVHYELEHSMVEGE